LNLTFKKQELFWYNIQKIIPPSEADIKAKYNRAIRSIEDANYLEPIDNVERILSLENLEKHFGSNSLNENEILIQIASSFERGYWIKLTQTNAMKLRFTE
jgi:hypothetical protein